MTFHLESFIKKMEKAPSMTDDSVHIYDRITHVFRMILDNDECTSELLSSCTVEELEWVFDNILYWPSWEAELEIEDLDHYGVQHIKTREIVHDLGEKQSIKKKVTFI